jgi:hypothetical protein
VGARPVDDEDFAGFWAVPDLRGVSRSFFSSHSFCPWSDAW